MPDLKKLKFRQQKEKGISEVYCKAVEMFLKARYSNILIKMTIINDPIGTTPVRSIDNIQKYRERRIYHWYLQFADFKIIHGFLNTLQDSVSTMLDRSSNNLLECVFHLYSVLDTIVVIEIATQRDDYVLIMMME